MLPFIVVTLTHVYNIEKQKAHRMQFISIIPVLTTGIEIEHGMVQQNAEVFA